MDLYWRILHRLSSFRNIPRKLDVSRAARLNYGTHHRSGWNQAISQTRLLHRPNGTLFDAFIERTFVWGDDAAEGQRRENGFGRPWVGVVHCPSDMPAWYEPALQPQSFLDNDVWRLHEQDCRGLFCLSEKEKPKLEKMVKLPIDTLLLPTETPRIKFSWEKYRANPKPAILQIGFWLRKMHSIYFLKAPNFEKKLLPGLRPHAEAAFRAEAEQFGYFVDKNSVPWIDYQRSDEYDELLSQNIVLLDLYDASANNVVVECMVRSTPILITRLPATRQYLGDGYPFFFDSLGEAADKAADFALAKKAHEYLKAWPLTKQLSVKSFLTRLTASSIYRALPEKA